MFDTLIKFSKDREKMDFYATDKRATHELLKREQFISPVYEPACGEGHIGKILEEYGYTVKATDICYRGYGEEREVDFFTVKENKMDIVTNPPYFCASEFLRHALEISGEGVKIAMLFRLAFLEGQKEYMYFPKDSIVLRTESFGNPKVAGSPLLGFYGRWDISDIQS